MLKNINCPLCLDHRKGQVSCQCGENKSNFKGDTVIHINQYCNSKYTGCEVYKSLRRRLQNVEAVTVR